MLILRKEDSASKMSIPFSKYSGSGNDFILIDNREGVFPYQHKHLVANLCDRRNGIGADGIILLEISKKAHFTFRIFNSDGSEAEMCGNGIRCFLKFLITLGFEKKQYSIETKHRVLNVGFKGDNVLVEMGDPCDVQWDKTLNAAGKEWQMHFMNTGVPHAIFFMEENSKENLKNIPIEKWGSEIRHHAFFKPSGTNVNFAMVDSCGEVWLRTYERGVEGETLACGTGATACALAAAKKYHLESPICVHPKSNETLEIGFSGNEKHTNVTMSGPASQIFSGFFSVENFFH